MTFIYPIGSHHYSKLGLAAQQAKLLGTSKYSSSQLSQEMYKIGMSYSVSVGQKETSVVLSGLTSQLDTSFKLLNHVLIASKANQEVTDRLIQKTLQVRENALKNPRGLLWNGLQNYAVYGDKSPLMSQVSNEILKNTESQELQYYFQSIFDFKPQVLFYGESNVKDIQSLIRSSTLISGLKVKSPEMDYKRKEMTETRITILDYDLKTSEILLISKGTPFKKSELAVNNVFNEYYGGGMSSVVFQEIREKKALAYSVFAAHTSAKDTTKPQYLWLYWLSDR
jgi:predicted Zn-dependent peptidase